MRRSTFVVILAAVLGALLVSGVSDIASAQRLINGAGATFPYPLYSKWFDEYAKVEQATRFNYQSIGSGGGIRQISERSACSPSTGP